MKPTPQAANKLAKAVRDSLESLKLRRPIFHSEGDFRHELASTLKCESGIHEIRAEWPFKLKGQKNRRALDILASETADDKAAKVAIELKYPTTKHDEVDHKGEKFKSGAASSVSVDVNDRRKFWEDVWRVDQLVDSSDYPTIVCGFAILITNRAGFWDGEQEDLPKTHEGSKVKDFLRLSCARTVHWKGWSDFSEETENGVFRCAIVEVKKP